MMYRSTRRTLVPLCLLGLGLGIAACDPYERFGEGESDLGPVDPVSFPPANLGVQDTGAPGNRKQPGQGSFSATPAFAKGEAVGYYAYPFPRAALAGDSLLVGGDAPNAYVFTADYKCTPPAGYRRNARLDEVPYDLQGNIFTALPEATYSYERLPQSSYLPVVAQIPVSSPKLPCQEPKSEEALARLGGAVARKPDGTLLAWLIIDPAAPVYAPGDSIETSNGVGLQRWGWFNRYLVAYLEGGAIAVADATVMVDGMPMTVPHMVTQRLYYPRSLVMSDAGMGPGELGAGYDVLAAKRGDAAYSPVCEVVSYDAGAPLAVAALPQDAAAVETMFGKAADNFQPGDPPYVFCLQLEAP
jgi:hypothetical protein